MLVGMVVSVLTGGVAALVIYPAAAVDAYLIGKKLSQGRPVGLFEFF